MTVHAPGKAQKRLEKTLNLHLRLTLGSDSLQQLNKTKPENPGEGGEYDFQSNHFIRVKCPVFNNNKKITRHIKKQNNMADSNEKNKFTEIISEKELMGDLPDKILKQPF